MKRPAARVLAPILTRSIAAAVAGTLLLPAGAGAGIEDDGRRLVDEMSRTVIDILSRKLPRAEKEARFRALFRRHFDVPVIGRWVMGRAWRVATPAQRRQYMDAFEAYIVKTYTVQLAQYGGERLKIVGIERDGRGVAVTSQIIEKDSRNRPVLIKWRLRSRGGGPLRVRDVVVDGISMSVNQRREFASVYARRGSIDGLISAIREKIDKLNSQ